MNYKDKLDFIEEFVRDQKERLLHRATGNDIVNGSDSGQHNHCRKRKLSLSRDNLRRLHKSRRYNDSDINVLQNISNSRQIPKPKSIYSKSRLTLPPLGSSNSSSISDNDNNLTYANRYPFNFSDKTYHSEIEDSSHAVFCSISDKEDISPAYSTLCQICEPFNSSSEYLDSN